MNKRKISLLLVGVLLVVFVTIGISYAVWSLNLKQEGTNTISTGCFNVTFSGINDINLQGAYPISDEEGASLTPYEFTITNTCEDAATYQINLEILNDSTLTELGIIKELLQEKGSTGTPKLLTSNNVVDKTHDNASSSYKLNTGTLGAKEAKTFELRLWMDENTEAIDSVMNKTLNSKITVITSFLDTKNMMVPMNVELDGNSVINNIYSKNNTYNIFEVIFESNLNLHEDAVDTIDLSLNQDGSVMGIYTPAEVPWGGNGHHNLYIQANGKIKAYPDARYYFSGIGFASGFENLDTSLVTDMSYAFYNTDYILNYDLSSLDTSNVKNMSHMFDDSIGILSLNLTGWNTINVVDMSHMFDGSMSITNLDLSSFDTKNVTNMKSMFKSMTSLHDINLSSFDTSGVTDMSSMFCWSDGLARLDISNFDTRKVTDMSAMFSGASELNTITYGSNFVYQNNADVLDMYNNCPANKPTDPSWEGVL